MFVSYDGMIVVNHVPNNDIKGYKTNEFFECDPLIAPVLAILNNKGYFTEASCQGHTSMYIGYNKKSLYDEFLNYSMFYSYPYVLFKSKVPYENFVNKNNESLIDGWDIEFIISTRDEKEPAKFVNTISKDDELLYFALRNNNVMDYNDYFKFTENTFYAIKRLYNFVLTSLPRRRGIKKPNESKAIKFADNFSTYLFDDEC